MFFLFLVSVSISVPLSSRGGGGGRTEWQGDGRGIDAPHGCVRRRVFGERHLDDGLSWKGGHFWLWTEKIEMQIRLGDERVHRGSVGNDNTTENKRESCSRQNSIKGLWQN